MALLIEPNPGQGKSVISVFPPFLLNLPDFPSAPSPRSPVLYWLILVIGMLLIIFA